MGADSSSASDDSDVEMDSVQSRSSSPARNRHSVGEASAILIDPGSFSYEQPRPTVEQNMAFAALQQSRGNERRDI